MSKSSGALVRNAVLISMPCAHSPDAARVVVMMIVSVVSHVPITGVFGCTVFVTMTSIVIAVYLRCSLRFEKTSSPSFHWHARTYRELPDSCSSLSLSYCFVQNSSSAPTEVLLYHAGAIWEARCSFLPFDCLLLTVPVRSPLFLSVLFQDLFHNHPWFIFALV